MFIKLRMFILRDLEKRYKNLSYDCFEKAKYYCNIKRFDKAERCVKLGRRYLTKQCNITSKLLKIAL